MATPRQQEDRFYRRRRQNPRGFEEIPIAPVSYQHGQVRSEGGTRRLCVGRLNLTGLSKFYNLHFVAFAARLHIYQPQYPTQKLPDKADYVLDLPRSAPNLRGHFAGSDAHAVNNLVVAELGDAEIVLCACDDGDVIAFWTKQVHDDLSTRRETGELQRGTIFELRPFFHQNVGRSAWGLDVHKAGRMIAVSSNTHAVHVFAFALQKPQNPSLDPKRWPPVTHVTAVGGLPWDQRRDSGLGNLHSSNDNSEDYGTIEWLESNRDAARPDIFHSRERNLKIILIRSHSHNIPSVGFLNAGSHDRGWHLVSTDIMGATFMWELSTACHVTIMSPEGIDQSFQNPERFLAENRHRSGWGVLWVDKRAFRRTHSIKEAIGSGHYIKFQDRCLIDVTRSLSSVQDTGIWILGPARGGLFDDNGAQSSEGDGSDNGDFDPETESQSFPPDPPSGHDTTLLDATRSRVAWPNVICAPKCCVKIPAYLTARARGAPSEFPDSPVFLLNPYYVKLYQSADFREIGPRTPVVAACNPVGQHTNPDIMQLLGDSDCLKLCVQIPELSMVIVGSGKGRAAILTCHALESNPMTDDPKYQSIYTFRVDWIIPFASQERKHQRPLAELVGIAAAPLQGSEGSRPTRPRRWRVLLTYRDHTVLAYELGGEEERLASEILVV